ncbi:DHA2 family efflux MFS transporter permease subunit [Paenibacillus radicis (ex Xue et al. 2023)]|uniref:DHA2 family efflux MFS transporter permease subunit n=1 Tax=Paenibacillus radicis (ex Xue et al. 2023) TaxID=2972489 RepID=A0ABT1YMS6_9BACL|nr:DHA2 family efflux MFS transporter permease subunit [Paenibacillus radicis (ex Xue et al. 2023)]MCR8633704.1 DHA2 family efflux MFS transporter permease subunit [Paenibacillus radicis (ex Xue et al. 2023)]
MNSQKQETQKKIRVIPILIAFLISGFIGLFSETALNIALSDLMKMFNVTSASIQWLTTGYLLTLGILVPISAFLIQRFTTRQLFLTSLGFSIIGSLVAAMAPNFEVLLTARVIQAIGTGIMLPLMFNTILVIFPPEKRGAAMGMIGLVIMFAPAVGPTAAGFLIQALSWHWIFWISVLFLAIALFTGIVYMQNMSITTKPKVDWLSIMLSTIGFGCVVFGFSRAGEGSGGWGHSEVILSIIVGVLALIVFSIRQLLMKQPMLNLRVFKYPMYTIGLIVVFVSMMIILASMLVLPMYLQAGIAVSTLATGLILLPGGVINGIMSPITGKLFDQYGPKWLVIPGLIVITVALWFFSTLTTASTITLVVLLHCILMFGISMVMMPAQTNGLNQLPRELYPDGTAVMNTMQQIAGAIGTAVAVSVMTAGQESFMKNMLNPKDPSSISEALTSGVQNVFIFVMSVSIAGLIAALFIKRVQTTSRP